MKTITAWAASSPSRATRSTSVMAGHYAAARLAGDRASTKPASTWMRASGNERAGGLAARKAEAAGGDDALLDLGGAAGDGGADGLHVAHGSAVPHVAAHAEHLHREVGDAMAQLAAEH